MGLSISANGGISETRVSGSNLSRTPWAIV
jgi:hypothetical protein